MITETSGKTQKYSALFNRTYLLEKTPTNTVISLKPFEKNIEIKVIVLDKMGGGVQTKAKNKITRFLVADQTASIYMNIYDELGDLLQPGDILYINGAYTSIYQDQLLLYEGKTGKIHKIGEFFFAFNEKPNISEKSWPNES